MIDVLGHPLEKGTVVLTAPLCETAMTWVTKVSRVTNTAVFVKIAERQLDPVTGVWTAVEREIRRRPDQFIAISAQVEYNKLNFPENQL